MPLREDPFGEENQFGENPEGSKNPEDFGMGFETFEKNPVNDINSSLHDNTMGVLDGQHADFDDIHSVGMPEPAMMPPPQAAVGMPEMPEPAFDEDTPEPALSAEENPNEGFGNYNTLG